jgi:UPF0755 protein
LVAQTPYNTYRIDGMPPTPICNPGRAALAAVLDPPSTRDVFFVADGTGGHAFAETYEQHLRNVARWRAIQDNDLRTGHVSQSVYERIKSEIDSAASACASGREGEASAMVRASRARHGYPG